MTEKYPSDWPCLFCDRTFDKHVANRDIKKYWCFSEEEYRKENMKIYAYQWFSPVDNLTYVERKAEGKLI